MSRNVAGVACLLVTASLLQGCTVWRSMGLARPRVHPAGQLAALSPSQARFTDIGRSQIDQGNFGLAANSFLQALAVGEKPGPALNGLGVSYAKIGRADLAAEYFRRAIAAEPRESRYSANLERLEGAVALREVPTIAAQVDPLAGGPRQAPSAVADADGNRAAEAVRSPANGLVQIGAHEFHIPSAASGPDRHARSIQMEGQRRLPQSGLAFEGRPVAPHARIVAGFQPVVRIDLAKVKQVDLSKNRPARQPLAQSRPLVRIDLTKVKLVDLSKPDHAPQQHPSFGQTAGISAVPAQSATSAKRGASPSRARIIAGFRQASSQGPALHAARSATRNSASKLSQAKNRQIARVEVASIGTARVGLEPRR